MKNALLTLCTLFLFTGSSFAQIDTVSTAKIDKYIGKEIVLKGILKGYKNYTDKNGQEIIFLNIDDEYPNAKVGVTLFNSALSDLNISDANLGKKITVYGLVEMYRDKPTIGVNDARSVTLE